MMICGGGAECAPEVETTTGWTSSWAMRVLLEQVLAAHWGVRFCRHSRAGRPADKPWLGKDKNGRGGEWERRRFNHVLEKCFCVCAVVSPRLPVSPSGFSSHLPVKWTH